MIQLKITDQSCIGAARRAAMALISPLEYTEEQASTLAIIVNELASNLLKHTNHTGQILLGLLESTMQEHLGIEILAIDKGPGINNLAQCLRDGYSTTGTLGTGLGAVYRLASAFNVYSLPGQGTVLQARYEIKKLVSNEALEISIVNIPKACEKISGDTAAVQQIEHRTLFLVADGLGHGPEAAIASQRACRVFMEKGHLPLSQQVMAIHTALRPTRGAAIAIAAIDHQTQKVHYIGLGNICGAVCSSKKIHHMVSHDGTAGLSVNIHVQEYVYPWYPEGLLIMHSDGLASRWDFKRYSGLTTRHPALIASVLYRDFTRGYDDTTVVVAQEKNFQ